MDWVVLTRAVTVKLVTVPVPNKFTRSVVKAFSVRLDAVPLKVISICPSPAAPMAAAEAIKLTVPP